MAPWRLHSICSCCYNICHSLHSRTIKLAGLREALLIPVPLCRAQSEASGCGGSRRILFRQLASLLLLPIKDAIIARCVFESEAHPQHLLFFA